MNINLDDNQMKMLMGEAILRAIDEKKRDELLKAAIVHLMTPENKGYGTQISPLQQAFNEAINMIARKHAQEFFETNEEARNKIQAVIVEGYNRFIASLENGKVYDAIAERLSAAFNRDRY